MRLRERGAVVPPAHDRALDSDRDGPRGPGVDAARDDATAVALLIVSAARAMRAQGGDKKRTTPLPQTGDEAPRSAVGDLPPHPTAPC